MVAAIIRLLTLTALVLMPMTTVSTPAMAHSPIASASGHCDESKTSEAPGDSKKFDLGSHCLACSALVPDRVAVSSLFIGLASTRDSSTPTFAQAPAPELATPPPKFF